MAGEQPACRHSWYFAVTEPKKNPKNGFHSHLSRPPQWAGACRGSRARPWRCSPSGPSTPASSGSCPPPGPGEDGALKPTTCPGTQEGCWELPSPLLAPGVAPPHPEGSRVRLRPGAGPCPPPQEAAPLLGLARPSHTPKVGSPRVAGAPPGRVRTPPSSKDPPGLSAAPLPSGRGLP